MVAKNNEKVNMKRRQQNQKFPSFQMFRFAAGGVGGAANKNDRKFLGFAPRELVERGRGASVIHQNPADFVQNTFELCIIHTAKIRNSNFRQKYGRREAPSVLHSPHKILILQGFATLRVTPRLPIQNYD